MFFSNWSCLWEVFSEPAERLLDSSKTEDLFWRPPKSAEQEYPSGGGIRSFLVCFKGNVQGHGWLHSKGLLTITFWNKQYYTFVQPPWGDTNNNINEEDLILLSRQPTCSWGVSTGLVNAMAFYKILDLVIAMACYLILDLMVSSTVTYLTNAPFTDNFMKALKYQYQFCYYCSGNVYCWHEQSRIFRIPKTEYMFVCFKMFPVKKLAIINNHNKNQQETGEEINR